MAETLGASPERDLAGASAGSLTFWQKLSLAIAGLAVLGFAQFAARGFVNVTTVPYWVHIHGVTMLLWLGVFVVQPWLAERGRIALHRRLGWFAIALAVFLVCLAMSVAILAMQLGRIPPMQTPGYFLAMNSATMVTFSVLFAAAIWKRRDRLSHQRLMMAATLMVIDPGIARMLPVPILGPWNETGVMFVQLAILAIVLRHDFRTLGRAHGATLAAMAAIAVGHGMIELVGRVPAVVDLGLAIAASS